MSVPPATMSTPPGVSVEVPAAAGLPMSAAVKWERSRSSAQARSPGNRPAAKSDERKSPNGFIRCRDLDGIQDSRLRAKVDEFYRRSCVRKWRHPKTGKQERGQP